MPFNLSSSRTCLPKSSAFQDLANPVLSKRICCFDVCWNASGFTSTPPGSSLGPAQPWLRPRPRLRLRLRLCGSSTLEPHRRLLRFKLWLRLRCTCTCQCSMLEPHRRLFRLCRWLWCRLWLEPHRLRHLRRLPCYPVPAADSSRRRLRFATALLSRSFACSGGSPTERLWEVDLDSVQDGSSFGVRAKGQLAHLPGAASVELAGCVSGSPRRDKPGSIHLRMLAEKIKPSPAAMWLHVWALRNAKTGPG